MIFIEYVMKTEFECSEELQNKLNIIKNIIKKI